MEKTTDVIIPTYRPGNEFGKLIDRLLKQTCPIHQNHHNEHRGNILEPRME